MKLFQVDTVAQARQKILDAVSRHSLSIWQADYQAACGLVLAEDLYAREDIPSFDRSTVDGYAVCAADTAGAGESIPAFLKLVGSVDMGCAAAFSIQPGQCAYVPTGGMLPPGGDAMVMIEYCERFGEGDIAVYQAVSPGRGLIRRGDDAAAGRVLLHRGTLLRPQEVGVLAAAGITSVPVYAPPTMAIISTGDELVPPGHTPGPGQVRDLNTAALRAQATQAGFLVQTTAVEPDDAQRLAARVESAAAQNDIVIISGGSSQGEKDYTAQVITGVTGRPLMTHGLAVKPGKPTIIGYHEEQACLLVGLPGHPVSAMLVFQLLLSWLWRAVSGQPSPYPVDAIMAHNVPGDPGKETLQLVQLHREEGQTVAVPVWGKSGLITRLSQADGYTVIDQNKEGIKKGEAVKVHLL